MAYDIYELDDSSVSGTTQTSNSLLNAVVVDGGVQFTFSTTSGRFMQITNPPGTGTGYSNGAVAWIETTFATSATQTLGVLNAVQTSDSNLNTLSGTASNPVEIRFFAFNTPVGTSTLNIRFVHVSQSSQNVIQAYTRFSGQSFMSGTASAVGQFSHILFDFSTQSLSIDSVSANVNCLCAGTRIATPEGSKTIESLVPGDRILTANGRSTTVSWVGRQPIDTRLHHPAKVNPIRISQGALGKGTPKRDLLISADHALSLDGMLVNAGALVNGTTIALVSDMPTGGFTYYHVETDGGHELMIAEGVAVETYIDYADATDFANAAQRGTSQMKPEMPAPRISARRMLPAGSPGAA